MKKFISKIAFNLVKIGTTTVLEARTSICIHYIAYMIQSYQYIKVCLTEVKFVCEQPI